MTLTEFRTQMIGFELYAEGHDIEACANDTERKGWRMAKVGEEHCDDLDALPFKEWGTYQQYEDFRNEQYDISDEAAEAQQYGWQN